MIQAPGSAGAPAISILGQRILSVRLLPRAFQIRCRQGCAHYLVTKSRAESRAPVKFCQNATSSFRLQYSQWEARSCKFTSIDYLPSDKGDGIPAAASRRPYSTSQTTGIATAVKRLMRHVPHPVAIITATDVSKSPAGGPQAWRGATVSSFNTVTLDPNPIISFNIKKLSATYDAIRSSSQFNVHLLDEGVEATNMATKFALGNALSPFHDRDGELEIFAQVAAPEKNASEHHQLPPILQSTNELGEFVVPHRLRCRYMPDKTVEIGDHVVVFGLVSDIFHDESSFHGHLAKSPKPCLVYVNGRYSRVEPNKSVLPLEQRRK